MGIDRTWNGKVLTENEIWVEEAGKISSRLIEVSQRIGIDYAGDDAKLPWRFSLKGSPWVSKI
jgi:DNA-3-methyladenine glycosylase